jgi:hypothetical protein
MLLVLYRICYGLVSFLRSTFHTEQNVVQFMPRDSAPYTALLFCRDSSNTSMNTALRNVFALLTILCFAICSEHAL